MDNRFYTCAGAGGGFVSGKCNGKATIQCCPSGSTASPKSINEMSPCPDSWAGADTVRDRLMRAATALYDLHKVDGIYTQDRPHEPCCRWQGITERLCPPQAPQKSDCSSSVSWIYWTVFGSTVDFLNGHEWGGGYTGTLKSNGRIIPCSDMLPGDLALFPGHVNMFIGNGLCVDHGTDPVKQVAVGRPDHCRRYIPDGFTGNDPINNSNHATDSASDGNDNANRISEPAPLP